MIPCKNKLIPIIAGVLGCLITQSAYSANWLMLQGTEKPGESPRAKVWGFVQPEYQSADGTKLQAGPWKGQDALFKLHLIKIAIIKKYLKYYKNIYLGSNCIFLISIKVASR